VPVPSTGWESDVQIQSAGVNPESPTRRRMVTCVLMCANSVWGDSFLRIRENMKLEIKLLQPEEILNFSLMVLALAILDPTLPTATPCSHSEGCVHHSTIPNEDAIDIRGRGLKEIYVDSGTVINHTSNEAQANSRTVHFIIYRHCYRGFPLHCPNS
jgi:hypothetical protein